MPTEKTPLTVAGTSFGSAPPMPFYVQDTHRFYSRRRRERQLQCIMFVTIIATFTLALVVTISYSVNHPDLLPPAMNVSSMEESATTAVASGSLKSAGVREVEAEGLSDEELKEALKAGNDAIAARRVADAAARPLSGPSAVWRHQFAVSTSARVNGIAMAGLAELAATRRIEQARRFMGRASSFGSYLYGAWLGASDLCAERLDVRCPAYAAKYRRFDGSCNQPKQRGMAYSPYRRVLPPDYADGIGASRLGKFGNPLPSAREVSLKVHPPSPSTNPSFTVMLAVFGQFLDHDITATAVSRGVNGSSLSCCPASTNFHPECYPVSVGPGDPVYDLAGSSCMEFVRSAPAAQCKIGPRQQLNQVTAFIDGSVIYGSDVDTAESLREFAGGRLRMQLTPDNRTLLPANMAPEDGCNRKVELARGRYCFASGDARANENLHLTTMHLLWARQHNLLAASLATVNPQWDDERLYQEARRIVGAQLQHVTYSEFLPIVLGEGEMARRGLQPLPVGFRTPADEPVDPSIANHFAAAAFRFAHTLLPDLMKITDKQKATTSYVQLHKMLFNPYSLYSRGGLESSITSATSNAIQKTSTHVTSQLTNHLFEDPLTNQTTVVPCGLDLVSLNIQRGRDHGLPGYVKWRQYCRLSLPANFNDLKADMDPEALAAISKLYDSVDDVDLYTGALSELPRTDGLLGPTFNCLIADQFQRLQSGDRYWYETAAQPGSFIEDQLQEIRKTTLARIICDTSDGITEIQPQVMRSIGLNNPMILCEDLAQLSLQAWKTDIPLIALTDTVVPTFDWLKFKTDVNNTISDIIANIAAKKPPVGSLLTDWLVFQNNVNATFSALRDKFAALHPKIATNVTLTRNLTAAAAVITGSGVFNRMGLKDDVSKTVSEIMKSIIANKPASESLPRDWLAYRKKINDSLLDVKKKFKVIHLPPKPMLTKPKADNSQNTLGEIPMIDWIAIRNDVNLTITDVVKSINLSKTLAGSTLVDWLAFRQKVDDSLIGIKNKFAGLYSKPILKLDKVDYEPTFDSIQFKDQLNKTLSDIIASAITKKPPPGSTPSDWLEFQKHMNKCFTQFVEQFSALHDPNELTEAVSVAETNVSAKKINPVLPLVNNKTNDIVANENVNETIAQIVAAINANKPTPGSPQEDWLAFRQKINVASTGMQSKYANIYQKNKTKTKGKPKLNKAADPATFDMMAFKDDLNKSLTSLVDLIKIKRPLVNSSMTDWLAYKNKVKASVSKLKKEISDLKTKDMAVGTDNKELVAGDAVVFDLVGWKNQINSTINKLLVDINTIPLGDPKWVSFRDYLNSTFSAFKDNFASLYTTQTQVKLVAIMKEDLLSFQDQVNSTIEDAIDDIVSNQSILDENLTAATSKQKKKNKVKVSVKNSLAEMRDNLKTVTTKWLGKAKAATDMMTVADTRLSAAKSSVATIDMTFIKFNFCATIVIVFMRGAF